MNLKLISKENVATKDTGEIMEELDGKWKSAYYSKPGSTPIGSLLCDRLSNVTGKKKKKYQRKINWAHKKVNLQIKVPIAHAEELTILPFIQRG